MQQSEFCNKMNVKKTLSLQLLWMVIFMLILHPLEETVCSLDPVSYTTDFRGAHFHSDFRNNSLVKEYSFGLLFLHYLLCYE